MKTFTTKDGRKLQRISRWIHIQQNYNPCKRNALWDYVRDENGNGPYNNKFNPENGLYLDYFHFSGRNWAIEQFLVMGSPWGGGTPYEFTDTDGKTTFVSAYDCENYYNPIMIELDEYGENIRVYQDVTDKF